MKALGGSPRDPKEEQTIKLLYRCSGASLVAGGRTTHMIRWRLRRSACSLLRRNHLNLLRIRVWSSAFRGSHRLRRRKRDFRPPHHLPSTITGGVVGGMAAQGQISTSTK